MTGGTSEACGTGVWTGAVISAAGAGAGGTGEAAATDARIASPASPASHNKS